MVSDLFIVAVKEDDWLPQMMTEGEIGRLLQHREYEDRLQIKLFKFDREGKPRECILRALPMVFDGEDWGDAQYMILDAETNVQVGAVGYRVDGRG